MNLFFRDQLHAEGFTTVNFVRLDVTDAATIHAAMETIEKAEEKLGIKITQVRCRAPLLPPKKKGF